MRRVAIVGRPNTGKSTLFNRLLKRRQAIVEDYPGVTRDRHYGVMEGEEGKKVMLIDTGGFLGEKEGLEAQIAQQVRFAVEEAELILWVVEFGVGFTAADAEFQAWLRKHRRPDQPIWLIVNKTDQTPSPAEQAEFHEAGIEPIFFVSALGGLGINALKQALLSFVGTEEASPEGPRFALIGRPNTGKSSLLNALVKRPRAIVSDIPGTTRDALYEPAEWKGKTFFWVDTAGLRRKAKIPAHSLERYAALRSLEALLYADVVLLVVDATEPLTAQDMNLLHLAESHGRGIVILLNKIDLLRPPEVSSLLEWSQRKVLPLQPVPILGVSALTGKGVGEIPQAAFQVYEEGQYMITTRELNDRLLPILRQNPPPIVGNLQPSVRFLQQIGTKPPTFLLHVRHPDKLRRSYLEFVRNQIRKIYPFTGWWLQLRLKQAD